MLRTERFNGFRCDERGAIAIIFGLALVMIVFAIGVSLDTARAVRTSSKVANALDAASLVAARAMAEGGVTPMEAKALAEKFFASQLNAGDAGSFSWSSFAADIDPAFGTVTVRADVSVPTSFARVLDINQLSFSKSATSVYRMRNVELAIVLDITGSMSGQKIADLKLAAHDLVEVLLPAGKPALNRISLVPYSASVNAGSYATLATDGLSLDGCAVERNGSHAYNDDAPESGRFFAAEEDPPVNPKYACPASEIMPLNSSAANLHAEIDAMAVGGWTAGHIGLGWGWYTISPAWSAVWPSASIPKAYTDPDTVKAIILMTDGEFNTSYHNGPMNATSPQQALDICAAIKDPAVTNGSVVIYSVAFQSPPAAEATLQACATSPSHYFSADNGTELRAAFQDIARRLQNLRIAK
jgi:Flp pilus assembly protein TadG